MGMYKSEDILVSLFLLLGLVGVEVSEIPDQEAAAVGQTFTTGEEDIVGDMHCPDFVFMGFESALDIKGDQIPYCYYFLTGGQHDVTLWLDEDKFDKTS